MIRFMQTTGLLMLVSAFVAGCWDIKNPQDVTYYTAVGFDYIDGNYQAIAQVLDFGAIAKSGEGKPSEELPIWVGIGEGKTAALAFNNLYDTSQFRVFYGHINAVVYSERVLERNIEPILDLQNRYYEMRYTPWVFGTDESIRRLLTVGTFFNLSPYNSLLHQPQDNFKQKSTIPPINVREFVSDLREPGKTTLLPRLHINKDDWTMGSGKVAGQIQPSPFLEIDGVYLFQDQKFRGFLKENKSLGLRWMTTKANRSPMLIQENGKLLATVSLEQPKIKITPIVRDDTVRFKYQVALMAIVNEMFEEFRQTELERLTEEQVEAEIRDAYLGALKLKADPLQLEYALYRKDVRAWKRLREDGRLRLQPDSVEIEVNVRLQNAGKLKVWRD
jgi:Ger(x)C family germination protein